MCGIFGAINFNNNFTRKSFYSFKELTDLVTYRGPDGSGYFSFDTKTNQFDSDNFNVFLGHRRLSILDLTESGSQPMSSGQYHITFNGEIYNYIELRNELKQRGIIFNTNSDTEIILKIYQEYGYEGFSKLNGMWAFAILDNKEKKVVLSRDRFAKKPLFYLQNNECFYFSSEIKQLLPFLKRVSPNYQILFSYLKQGILDYTDETFFSEINRVESKSVLIVDLRNRLINTFKYWSYEILEISKINALDQFRFLLEDSVKLRMRSDVPIGCMLSGGLDSSAISLIAHKTSPTIDTFSVISDDKSVNEEPFIDIVINAFKLQNIKMNFQASHVLTNLNHVLYHQDEPFFNLSILASYSIFKKIKSETDIVVLLNGQGGDELLLGYLKYFFFYERELVSRKKYLDGVSLLLSAIFNRTILNQFNLGKAKRYMSCQLSKKSSYILENEYRLIDTWSSKALKDRQKLDIDNFSIPVLCRYEDRNSTAHSLEIRIPFLDYRLVNFCLNLDNKLKIRNGWTKYILRMAMNDLPNSIRFRRDKKGFTVPEEKFLREDLKEQIFSIGKYSLLEELGAINKKKFIEYYIQFLKGKGGFTEFTDITRVFIAEMWARKYINH